VTHDRAEIEEAAGSFLTSKPLFLHNSSKWAPVGNSPNFLPAVARLMPLLKQQQKTQSAADQWRMRFFEHFLQLFYTRSDDFTII
jgi:hypothetical protein